MYIFCSACCSTQYILRYKWEQFRTTPRAFFSQRDGEHYLDCPDKRRESFMYSFRFLQVATVARCCPNSLTECLYGISVIKMPPQKNAMPKKKNYIKGSKITSNYPSSSRVAVLSCSDRVLAPLIDVALLVPEARAPEAPYA